MSAQRQAWLAAVGTSEEPLPNEWVFDNPDLLRRWPLLGGRYQPGIESGAPLLLYGADHKVLLGSARATGSAADADASLGIQTYLVIPVIKFAPDWEVLGVEAGRLTGKRAITLSDEEYERGLEALTTVARRRFTG